ncbi:MAG: hypothetical protein ACI9RO_000390 [Alteromonas macleodii]|jgi:uncharacterized protein (TIGR02300 family)
MAVGDDLAKWPVLLKEDQMPKEEWGTKRLCPTTGKRFYDLNADPIISPYSGETVVVETGKTRTMVADAADAQTKAKDNEAEDDDLVLDDDDDDENESSLGDDVLEDEDDDTIPLDEIADVAAPSDDN